MLAFNSPTTSDTNFTRKSTELYDLKTVTVYLRPINKI